MDKFVIVSRKHPAEKELLAVQMRQNMTVAERTLWERLRRNQVGGLHFRRQQIIDGFIADFYCHTARLVIEADGGVHDAQADYDRERDEIIATHQITILRFTNHQIINDTETVMAQITAAVHASVSSPSVSFPSISFPSISFPPLKEGPGEVL